MSDCRNSAIEKKNVFWSVSISEASEWTEEPAETSLGWGHGHLNQGGQALDPSHLLPDLILPHLVIFFKKLTKN